jgi:hypothetical protein
MRATFAFDDTHPSSPLNQSGDFPIANRIEGSQPKKNMASAKKKATAKTAVKFKDLHSKKNPKGGIKFTDSAVKVSSSFLK